jgi:hypothetical protein
VIIEEFSYSKSLLKTITRLRDSPFETLNYLIIFKQGTGSMNHENSGQLHNKKNRCKDIAYAFLCTIGLDHVTMEMKSIVAR